MRARLAAPAHYSERAARTAKEVVSWSARSTRFERPPPRPVACFPLQLPPAMFRHYYDHPSETSDPDWPEPVVVSLDALDAASLAALPAYLGESIELRYQPDAITTHLGCRPIVFEIGSSVRLTERAIWSILVELPTGAESVESHVAAVIAATPEGEELAFYSTLDVVGQDPLYAYFDRFLRRSWLDPRRAEESLIRVIDSFGGFLRRCDMDHETFQDDYIGLALRFLQRRDPRRFVDLLAFRLTSGQLCELSADRGHLLTGDGVLKAVVDRVLAGEDGWSMRVDVLRLCYAVYGSNAELTDDVLDYCRQRVDLDEDHDIKAFLRELSFVRDNRDLVWSRRQMNLDTGFHRYDKRQQRWTRLI